MNVPNDPGCTFLVRRQLRPAAGLDTAMPEIGLVGLGRMGLPICANLVQAGYRVLAGDRRPEAARQAAGCGARWVPEVGRLAAGADVLITILPGPGEVRELMLGTDGAAAALRPGTTWIDMTSNSPAAVTDIRNALLDHGVQVLDAPAGGGVAAARQGSLQLLVGGQAEILARHRELLEILGGPGRVRHVGGYGAGYTAKLLINLLWFGQAVATAEALLLGRASGLDLGVLREVLADSAAGSDFIRHDLDALFAGDFMRTFALDRCYEELQTVTELARDHHLPFQVSESVADLYRQALRRYGPADGELLGIALLEEQAHLGLRHPPAADEPDDPGPLARRRSASMAQPGWGPWRSSAASPDCAAPSLPSCATTSGVFLRSPGTRDVMHSGPEATAGFFGCALTIAWPAQPAGPETRECGMAINDDDITSEPGNTGEGTADGGANPGGHDGGADGPADSGSGEGTADGGANPGGHDGGADGSS